MPGERKRNVSIASGLSGITSIPGRHAGLTFGALRVAGPGHAIADAVHVEDPGGLSVSSPSLPRSRLTSAPTILESPLARPAQTWCSRP